MKKQKKPAKHLTHIQRLQSRISRRGREIAAVAKRIEFLAALKKLAGSLSPESQKELAMTREASCLMGKDQKLDKELYQLLLGHRREQISGYFRSAYLPVSFIDFGMNLQRVVQ